MGKIPDEQRQIIAQNIRACRKRKFPGRGGGQKCAAMFSAYVGKNISPQQWSPWESGLRTPEESRLRQIASFFDTSVEYMRRDNRNFTEPHNAQSETDPPAIPDIFSWNAAAPGSAESFFLLARYFVLTLQQQGLRIDKESLKYLAAQLKKQE